MTNRLSEEERDNIALIKRWFKEVWNDRRTETIYELISPDFVGHYEHGDLQGAESYKENIFDSFICGIPDFSMEIDDVIARGDHVVTRWRAKGIHSGKLFGVPPSHKRIELNGISWTKFVDGKIVENLTNWNMSYLLRALLSEVKILRDIVPLCSFCKKVRNEKGYWEQVDVYLQNYSQAEVSHSICGDCMKLEYPEEWADLKREE